MSQNEIPLKDMMETVYSALATSGGEISNLTAVKILTNFMDDDGAGLPKKLKIGQVGFFSLIYNYLYLFCRLLQMYLPMPNLTLILDSSIPKILRKLYRGSRNSR
jgi:hypothetical protein